MDTGQTTLARRVAEHRATAAAYRQMAGAARNHHFQDLWNRRADDHERWAREMAADAIAAAIEAREEQGQ